jgi:hypothetical protein
MSENIRAKIIAWRNIVIVRDYLSECLTQHGLVGKVVGLCADNTNSNFGGAESKCQNNIFTKQQKNL